MARFYTLVNQKGGVGKTTTAINLGAYLAKFGQRVLIVDLDPQSNATSCLGVDKRTVKQGTYEALLGLASASSSLLTNPDLNLSLLPSSPALAGAEVELVEAEARESRLRKALEPLNERFDYVLIDCPPSLSLLTVNGLMAAREGVIIPVQCEYLALEGLGQLMSTLQRIRTALFPGLAVRGVVFNHVRCARTTIVRRGRRSAKTLPRPSISCRCATLGAPGRSPLLWLAHFSIRPALHWRTSV